MKTQWTNGKRQASETGLKRWFGSVLTAVLVATLSLPVLAQNQTSQQHDASTKAPPAGQQTVKPQELEKEKQTSEASTTRNARPVIGWLEIEEPLRIGPSPFAWVSEDEAGLSLQMAVEAIDRVAKDDAIEGLVISLSEPQLTLVEVDQLTKAIARAREAGKKVLTFAESYDMSSYMLAAAADQILLQHKGMVELHGLGVEEMYFAGLLERIGLKADFVQVGQYKGAEDPLTRTGPSEAWSANIDALLDDMYALLINRIGQGRKLSKAEIEKLFVDVWSLSDQELVDRKVVDVLCDRDLAQATSKLWGDDFTWVDLNEPPVAKRPQSPFAMMSLLFQEKEMRIRRDTIATIWAQGQITGGESAINAPIPMAGFSPRASLFGGSSIGSKTIVRAIEEARDHDRIKGVVLYIDSPGGSALASELMWQAVHDLAEYKPVYVVVGSMAASGGYYMASAGDRIYVSPGSILGSIGVVGGKIIMGDLYDKVGINVHRRVRGPMGDMFNSSEPFTPQQRQAVSQAFKQTYEQFLDRVTTGRGDKLKDIDKVAQGRLFMGTRAVELGMADKIGGMELAVDELAADLSLTKGQYDVVSLPGPLSLGDFLNQTFGGVSAPAIPAGVDMSGVAMLRQLMGPRAWRAMSPVLGGMLLLQDEPVLTIMPAAIVIR